MRNIGIQSTAQYFSMQAMKGKFKVSIKILDFSLKLLLPNSMDLLYLGSIDTLE